MATSSGVSKRRKHAVQLEAPLPEEKEIPEATWGAEPNFNLNLTLTSPSNPRNFSKMHFSKKRDESNKEEGKRGTRATAAMEPKTLVPRDEKPKSRIPALTPATEVKVNTDGNLLKPPNVKPVQTLSPEAQSKRSHQVEQTANDPTVRTKSPTSNLTSDLEIQSNAEEEEDGRNFREKTTTPQTLCVPINPKKHIKTEETNRVSPKLASRFPTGTKKTEVEIIPNMTNPKAISKIPCPSPQTKKTDSAHLCTKTLQVSSLSPKPWMQRTTNTTTGKKSQSKENLNDKDINSCSGSKTNAKFSNSKEVGVPKNCKDSTSNHSSTSLMGSMDTLDSKSSSDSKSSLDSEPVSRISHRISTDPKSLKETKLDKSYPDSKTFADSKTAVRSRVVQDSECVPISEASLTFNASFKATISGVVDPPLTDSHCVQDLCGPDSPMLKSGPKIIRASAKPSSDLKAEPETLPIPLEDFSSSMMLSSPLVSASIKTGSGVCFPGPLEEYKRSTCFVPGLLAPLATSSPKNKVKDGSKLESTPNDSLKANSGESPGLIQPHAVTKTTIKTVVGKEHLKVPQGKVKALGGLPLCPEAATVSKRSPGDPRTTSLTTHEGTEIIINSGGNILQSGKRREGSEKEAMKSLSASGLLFSPHICLTTSKMGKETWTMTDHHGRQSPQIRDQKDVGIQVGVETSERSTSTSPSFGTPWCQPAATNSVSSVSAERSSLKHVCKIDIELRGQSLLPSIKSDKSQSLPACLRNYTFQEEPSLTAPLRQNQDKVVSADSIWEDDEEDEEAGEKAEKPQAVVWDEQGMTWEVYGASVDLESLGTAIQSHLESKIRDQEKHIRTLRKSICSEGNLLSKKRKKGRGGALVCCGGASAVSD